jgi:succinoglycan biosynthesis protein ExoW
MMNGASHVGQATERLGQGERTSSGVHVISVIIPFFQREPGVLRRTLKTVISQQLPPSWFVEVIVVDDGSPSPPEDEFHGLDFNEPFLLKLVRQANGGVSAARNRGLDEADAEATLIAFLDSDDMWPEDHLARAILAWELSFDFYFTDQFRKGLYDSWWRSPPHTPKMAALIDSSPHHLGLMEIDKEAMIELLIREFPCSLSTLVYRANIDRRLRFVGHLRNAAEDIVYLVSLACSTKRVCADKVSKVECGNGVNIWFSNQGWHCERFLSTKVDEFFARWYISNKLEISRDYLRWNDEVLSMRRKDLAAHLTWNLRRHPKRAAREMRRLVTLSPSAAMMLPAEIMLDLARRLATRVERGIGKEP